MYLSHPQSSLILKGSKPLKNWIQPEFTCVADRVYKVIQVPAFVSLIDKIKFLMISQNKLSTGVVMVALLGVPDCNFECGPLVTQELVTYFIYYSSLSTKSTQAKKRSYNINKQLSLAAL